MLDTNILIYFIKNKPTSVAARINQLHEFSTLCMSFITYAELLKGVEKSDRKTENLQKIQQLTKQVPVIFTTGSDLCRHYAHQSIRLNTAGTPIGANDLWIACHALSEGAILVTNNTREFARITELKIENWATS
jgi:tRNA(fMet)-specific endonuclease VapC